MFNLKKIKAATYLMPREGNMRVPGLVIATEQLLQEMDIDQPLEQVRNVACLPGIAGHSIAMPDIHWGYGFPIGGVAAMDVETGVISPGGVGYDINCGVRLAVVPESFKSFSQASKQALINSIFKSVPSGVGRGHKKQRGLSDQDYRGLVDKGAKWSVEQGYGFEKDLEHMESNGLIQGG
ncbi:MAG TPA: RtcB family protein, partial [Waddliaceae bacterium]